MHSLHGRQRSRHSVELRNAVGKLTASTPISMSDTPSVQANKHAAGLTGPLGTAEVVHFCSQMVECHGMGTAGASQQSYRPSDPCKHTPAVFQPLCWHVVRACGIPLFSSKGRPSHKHLHLARESLPLVARDIVVPFTCGVHAAYFAGYPSVILSYKGS